ncbi:aminopeptidase [Niallia circulans]|jgi:leucyl aminopeptidase (aminopeptidase T)|uniref:Aminopeptidase n=1 Tax=Niallia circulans TaxID=1397 RepID=A0A0J1ING8_NIACI|nr:aminopeptidase [Niallia circulans]KLV27524.1 aminopeptidase [Niallia circulans]MCM2981287.1 aminopeptidase [Niallia circulans]MDR4316835.1 aminopeptidase [Niallia circulans]MED3840171.1 aminopeptidase [Niallia circulans]MED4241859.1 aminopeptidase [Niallia circulans]
MNEKMIETSKNVLANCLGIKEGELFLVVTDEAKKEIAESIYEAGKALHAETMLIVMQDREKSGQEPPATVAAAMKAADVAVCVTAHSLTHTQARKEAVETGTRLATMPGITKDMFLEGAISADYEQVRILTEEITEQLTKGKQVKIEKDGYCLAFDMTERQGIPSTGMYLHPGESGNLPSGEAYIAPVEGTAAGTIVVDGSVAGIGKLSTPLKLKIEEGRLVEAEGEEGEQLLKILGNGEGRMLAEFGIGTNDKARITGVVLEDEKVYGTIHIAFGSNDTFGGTVSAGVHIDGVVTQPTVYIDDALLMEKGVLIK